MEFPYKPKAVFHKFGGQLLEITGVGHKTERPKDGHSRDYWFYLGKTRWEDGSGVSEGQIDPRSLCADCADGREEIDALSDALMAYLARHGQWRETAPRGWYATREPLEPVSAPTAARKGTTKARGPSAGTRG